VSETLRAHVDEQVCVGTGLCEATAPALFEVGDDGTSHVLLEVVPAELLAAARKAAEDCPTRALTLEAS
jgi:ferredoxin